MRFLPATWITLIVGLLFSAGLYGLEFVQVPPAYVETLAWLGHFHMVILHIPIGLLVAWALLQCMQWFMPHHDIDPAISTMLFFTWGSAVLAVCSGTFLDWYGKYSPESLNHHRDAALLFTAFLTMAMTFRVLRKLEENVIWVLGYAVCFVGAAVMMTPTGHRGGSLTHGADFLTKRAPDYVNSFLEDKKVLYQSECEVNSEDEVAEQSYFNETILPIFEEYCTRCHGVEKQKGDLRLDSYVAMLEGGENGAIIDAEHPEEGSMWYGLIVEVEDDLHMPPDGKPQLELEELAILKAWILAGAKEQSL